MTSRTPASASRVSLGDDLLDRPRHFGAARIGDDAEGAELVAAFLHGEESGNSARADGVTLRRCQHIELVFDRKLGVDDLFTALGACQQFGQAMIGLRADDEVDGGARRMISSPSAWATQPATATNTRRPLPAASCLITRNLPSSE